MTFFKALWARMLSIDAPVVDAVAIAPKPPALVQEEFVAKHDKEAEAQYHATFKRIVSANNAYVYRGYGPNHPVEVLRDDRSVAPILDDEAKALTKGSDGVQFRDTRKTDAAKLFAAGAP